MLRYLCNRLHIIIRHLLAFILPPYKYKEYFCISKANRRIESGLSMGQRPKSSNEQYALNQRSPAEGKGKGQKLLEAARPEGAEAHSPGQRPGLCWAVTCRPVRAKALKLLAI